MKNMRRYLPMLAVSAMLLPAVSGRAQTHAYTPAPSMNQPSPRPSQSSMQAQSSAAMYSAEQASRGASAVRDEIFAKQQIEDLAPAKFDRDGNGRFDEKEFRVWLTAVRSAVEVSPSAMSRFDTNKDGKLDNTEWAVVAGQLVS